MTEQSAPIGQIINAQDFEGCGWHEAQSAMPRKGYAAMWHAFSSAAQSARNEGRKAHAEVLKLLSCACSMILAPKNQNEPFKAGFEFGNRRGLVPSDFGEGDITFFVQIIDAVDEVWLKARIADLLWLRVSPRQVTFALMAIDSYRAIPLDCSGWTSEGQDCWQRAIILSRMLRTGAGDRLKQMEDAAFGAFNSARNGDGTWALSLANLLFVNKLGNHHESVIAQKLEVLGDEFSRGNDHHRARDYFEASASWFERAGDMTKIFETIGKCAEEWVKDAGDQLLLSPPSFGVAASFYENAIQTYRKIPRAVRAARSIDNRIAELRTFLSDSGEKALSELGAIGTPPVDITDAVVDARNAIAGKTAMVALRAFANIHQSLPANERRERVVENMRRFPLLSLIPMTTLSRDGRVIAKRPGIGFGQEGSKEVEAAVREAMVQEYSFEVALAVHGRILPAREVLLLEHQLREMDFVALANGSPIVPKDRAVIWGRALYAGYDGDLLTALHLLIPQIEHMVRVHLKTAGVSTANIDQEGIENENGLSALMALPEVERVFGPDVAFEIRALCCDAFGPNLRNELAHGLLQNEKCYSQFGIYAWWLGFKLVFMTWWSAIGRSEMENGSAEVIESDQSEPGSGS